MHRFRLTFLIAFFVVSFVAKAQQPIDIVFGKVSVDITSQKITLSWIFDHNIDSVTIYKPGSLNWEPITKVAMSSANLQWIDPDPNVTTRKDYRIGSGFGYMTPPQCTMVLEALTPSNPCPNAVLLSWNPYLNMMDSLKCYNILYKEDTASSFRLYKSITGKHYSDIDSVIKNPIKDSVEFLTPNTYQFVIQAISKNDTLHAFSNIVEYETYYTNTDLVDVTITCVSVINDNAIEVHVNTDTFPEPPLKICLLRDVHKPKNAPQSEDFLSFTEIYTWNYTDSNSYFYSDNNVKPREELYYYKAVASHKCKIDDVSNILTNIHLAGDKAGQYEDSVRFFQIGIPLLHPDEYFNLYRIVYREEDLIAENLTLTNNRYLVDITPFFNDGVPIKFQIKSENGCYSNTLVVDHEPDVIFPTAFYPGSMESVNQTFYPIIDFPAEENTENQYLFIIYNRWGQEVFRSNKAPLHPNDPNFRTDKTGRWDGIFNGKDCPEGIYAYKISFTYHRGAQKYSDSGSVMLVR